MEILERNLTQLRDEIDEIDNRLIELLGERMSRVTEIGKIKKINSIEIYHPDREISLIQKLIALSAVNGINEQMVLAIWHEIMKNSRQLQNDIRMGNE